MAQSSVAPHSTADSAMRPDGVTPSPAEAPRRPPRLADQALQRTRVQATPGIYTRAWRTLRRNPPGMFSLAFLILVVLFVLGADVISRLTGFTYAENHLSAKLTPVMTDGYLLGSDNNGRDVLTRLAYGGRVSLAVGLLATIATLLLGVSVGLICGYLRGPIDAVVMRFNDVLTSIPGLPLLILIAVLFQPGPAGLALVLAAVGWSGIARTIRGQVLSLRTSDYVEAARVSGASTPRVMLRHLLPNVMPLVVIYTSLLIPGLIVSESALSFIGVGVQVPTPSWGNMLNEAYASYRLNVANLLIPGAMIFFTALAFFLLSSALRDALDPRMNA